MAPQDRQRINMSEDYEVAYWSKKWDVSGEQLAEAVRKASYLVESRSKTLKLNPPGQCR